MHRTTHNREIVFLTFLALLPCALERSCRVPCRLCVGVGWWCDVDVRCSSLPCLGAVAKKIAHTRQVTHDRWSVIAPDRRTARCTSLHSIQHNHNTHVRACVVVLFGGSLVECRVYYIYMYIYIFEYAYLHISFLNDVIDDTQNREIYTHKNTTPTPATTTYMDNDVIDIFTQIPTCTCRALCVLCVSISVCS